MISKYMAEDYESERKWREEWALGDYIGQCPKCGRHRLCICPNGKHRCEKCDWCPEKGEYIKDHPLAFGNGK
uniref:Uncharacterized protein n=1 Tax=viral metagenome TaxID=1070528 RepID=A0A6H2A6T0_9ZZZZ